uniref:Uncharacterized protein n=1 Tax=Anguilla anguilla TaxID=7936 RepID=A0A0E9X1H7_ANGAN
MIKALISTRSVSSTVYIYSSFNVVCIIFNSLHFYCRKHCKGRYTIDNYSLIFN